VIEATEYLQLSLLKADIADPPREGAPFEIAGSLWRTTEVFDTYWRFAFARQEVFFNRLYESLPYTNDPIIQVYKFTNPYRAADRVSQFLIRNVIYDGDQSPEQVFFRILLFKIFNKIETWELLTENLGELRWSGNVCSRIGRLLSDALSTGKRVYSAAYIMPSGGGRYPRKHDAHLNLLADMMAQGLWRQIQDASGMEEAFHMLRRQPMLGDFLAYQFITDINYSNISNFSELEFVVAGPGARDGLRKCFPDLPMDLASEAIRAVCAAQTTEFASRNLDFKTLWGRPLQLIDCQNLFCETDKYSRIAHPNIAGLSGRTRIKQQFRANGALNRPFFPPKWGIAIAD
jgi:hypothetical protein